MSLEDSILNLIALGIYIGGLAATNIVIWGSNHRFLEEHRQTSPCRRTLKHLLVFFWPIGLPLWLLVGPWRR